MRTAAVAGQDPPTHSPPLTVVVLLAAFPEARVEVTESELVFPRLPDVVDGVGQLPLPDLGQLVPPGRRQGSVVGVLSGALWRNSEDL